MDKLHSIFHLREVLRGLERDAGIDGLSLAERDVFLAAHSLTSSVCQVITSGDIREHHLIHDMPPATFHRALKSLLGLGLLELSGDYKTRNYIVRADLIDKLP